MVSASGAQARVNWGLESTWKTASTSINKTFGHAIAVTALERSNDLQRLYSLGDRNAQVLLEKRYTGTISIEGILADPWWFRPALGSVSTSTSAPYVHTFSEAMPLPSMTILNAIDLNTDYVAKYLGGFINRWTLRCRVNEPITFTLDIPYATESQTSSGMTQQVSASLLPLTFAYGYLYIPSNATQTVGIVQACEITATNNVDLRYGLGDRVAQTWVELQREYEIIASVIFDDTNTTAVEKFLKYLYGNSVAGPQSTVPETSLYLKMDNGLTGSNQNKIEITFANVKFASERLAPQRVDEAIIEEATIWGRSCSVVATNNISAFP